MKFAFWGAAAFVCYAYLGYAFWLWIECQLQPAPVRRGQYVPFVTVVMSVRDEERTLPEKLKNLNELDYPWDRLEFVIVSDGSRDSTARILSNNTDARLHVLTFEESKGKAARLNDAFQLARGEIVLFVDARQLLERESVRLIMENFAETTVGAVSGELMLGTRTSGETDKAMGIYWRLEKKIRELESASGSVVGATGAIYAVRRGLLVNLPVGTILDDVFLPLHVARQGYRIVFDGRARAWDVPDLGSGREFRRKVRTLTGNYQLLQIAPWLLGSQNPLRFRFISHKLVRLVVPFALAITLVSSAMLRKPFYQVLFLLQLSFYALSVFALTRVKVGPLGRIGNAALAMIVLNSAAVVAFGNFLRGRKEVWVR